MEREVKFSLVFRDMWQSAGKYVPRVDQLVKVAPAIIEMGCLESIKHFAHPFKNITAIFPLTVFCIPQDIQLYVKKLLKLQAILCLTQ